MAVSPAEARPSITTCDRVSASGFSRTGFIRTSGSTPAARAWSHWATPISPPSTTRALFDMFWALNGTTSTPWRANHRHSAVTSQLLPAPDVQPSTISGRIRAGSRSGAVAEPEVGRRQQGSVRDAGRLGHRRTGAATIDDDGDQHRL